MSIFGRYLFRQVAGALLLILLSLSGVVWIALALRQLNLVTTQGQDAWVFLIMTTLALPNLMALIAPIALLIAAIHTLNRLNGDSELIVLTASGATVWTVARPLILLALLVSLAVSFVNHVGMPWSLRLLRDYIIQVRTDLISQVLQPGQFSSPERNLTFHIRDRTYSGELLGILMQDARDEKQIMSYLAERGVIVKQGDATLLVMTGGHIVRQPDTGEPPQVVTFESYAIDLNRFEPRGERDGLKPRERYFGELAFPEPDDPYLRHQPGQFRAEFHERLANPLYPLAFVMIAVAFAGQARSTRQNRVEAVVFAFLLAAAIRLGGLAANNLVVIRASAVPLLYLLPLGGIALALVVMRLNARPRGGPSAWDRLVLAADAMRGAAAPVLASRAAPRGVRRQRTG
ncbi:MAG: LPS export ABC transporter permease LptF [Hyphomicrobiaceae bacterium]|nr:LPS export ABC transporter permease LptF [Hyphomicrobiaceae bacterium]